MSTSGHTDLCESHGYDEECPCRVGKIDEAARKYGKAPEPQVCEVFGAVVDLSIALGVQSIDGMPGCWVHNVDEHWTIAVNGHGFDTIDCQPEGTMGCDVPPFHMAVWWNGGLAGIISPAGGTIVAHPEGANEDRLIRDLRTAIKVRGRDH